MSRLLILSSLILAGCATVPADPPPNENGTICRGDELGRFIGQIATGALGSEMLRASGARILRWVPLGGAVTMDFSPQRLTVQLDGAIRVRSANCG